MNALSSRTHRRIVDSLTFRRFAACLIDLALNMATMARHCTGDNSSPVSDGFARASAVSLAMGDSAMRRTLDY
jgi:hypothetical protein